MRVILERENEIGDGGAEPFAEAMLHYRKFLQFVEDRGNVNSKPSFLVFISSASVSLPPYY